MVDLYHYKDLFVECSYTVFRFDEKNIFILKLIWLTSYDFPDIVFFYFFLKNG